ncbi:MAG TPA: hypothetical protein VFA55_09970, partial [Candidatus Kapabacteria bacterium]|nr:hypothetical protein [Candidatus Kapabacteria bacterium]
MKYIIAALLIACFCGYTTNTLSAKSRENVERTSEKTVTNSSKESLASQNLNSEKESGAEENDDPGARARFEHLWLQDPATGELPPFIRQKELEFASHIPSRERSAAYAPFKTAGAQTQATTWSLRGPYNIGGRTRGLGIDVSHQNIIIAGGISGGAWRSTDNGGTWVRTTPLNVMPSMSCLAQDTRAGKTNTWYYGTGEAIGNSEGYPLQDYTGDGIFKSTDDGVTWNLLPSTANNSVVLSQPFNYVYNIAVDPSNVSQDIVYAATIYGIERSTNGGATWAMTLPGQGLPTYFSDVSVTSTGVVYAAINSNGAGDIYRSTDGVNWTDITPSGWQSNVGNISIGVAPSDQKVVYFLLNVNGSGGTTYSFWKYTYNSGNGTGTGGTWEDRSANVPSDFESYGGYCEYVKVKPDQENVVFLGGLDLYRSTDGLATSSNVSTITGYMHVDQHSMAFFKSDPTSMVVGNDGGLFMTSSNTAPTVSWNSLDNGYYTTQFYTVAIDHSTPGNTIVIGGMQDNSTFFTNSTDPTQAWSYLSGGDGTSCAISSGRSSYYVSYQNGNTYREIVNDNGNIISYGRIDPPNSSGYLWVNPMALDPNNTNRMYFGG